MQQSRPGLTLLVCGGYGRRCRGVQRRSSIHVFCFSSDIWSDSFALNFSGYEQHNHHKCAEPAARHEDEKRFVRGRRIFRWHFVSRTVSRLLLFLTGRTNASGLCRSGFGRRRASDLCGVRAITGPKLRALDCSYQFAAGRSFGLHLNERLFPDLGSVLS